MHIDHDYNVNAAKLAKEAGIAHYGLLSSVGANPNSFFTYTKCKGLIEEDVKAMDFATTSIFRPGLLNRGKLARWNERLFMFLSSSTPVGAVAKAMRLQAGLCVGWLSRLEMDLECAEKGRVTCLNNAEIKKMGACCACFMCS